MSSGGLLHERGWITGSAEWYTPPHVFESLGLDFDLDPAAPPGGVPWIPARRHYTETDDGLAQPWEGRVWLNPPYGARPAGGCADSPTTATGSPWSSPAPTPPGSRSSSRAPPPSASWPAGSTSSRGMADPTPRARVRPPCSSPTACPQPWRWLARGLGQTFVVPRGDPAGVERQTAACSLDQVH